MFLSWLKWLSVFCAKFHVHRNCIINPWRACAKVIVVALSVCVSVSLSVKSHLASGVSVRSEIAVKYSVCNVGRKICGIFSDTVSFQSCRTSCTVRLP